MYSINPNFPQYNYTTTGKTKSERVGLNTEKPVNKAPQAYVTNPKYNIPFNSALHSSDFRTKFVSNEEKQKYNNLQKMLDRHSKKALDALLKKGILLNADSNDNSTVLDNLHKIANTPRSNGLNNLVTLKETINTLNNPFVINQEFGDIPSKYQDYAKQANSANASNLFEKKAAENDINVTHSGTCVAASIEFNMAQKHPAEFTRFVEGLSSPNMSVQKEIHLNNLADNTLDAIWLLNAFEIPYEAKDFNKATLTFAPDKNAIIRAQIQTTDKDPQERSVVDVLMQSTLMQVGSQQSYNTLTDKRQGKFNQNDKGLIEFEKTFTESVVEDKNKISVTYQTVDENAKLIGYETDMATMKRHLVDSLDRGENVIIGYTQVDKNNIIINGHEITILGYKQGKDGKLTFICNDTDDNQSKAIEYSENYLLPKIHHAALPHDIVENDVKLVENWVEGIKTYKELKKKQKEQQLEPQLQQAA